MDKMDQKERSFFPAFLVVVAVFAMVFGIPLLVVPAKKTISNSTTVRDTPLSAMPSEAAAAIGYLPVYNRVAVPSPSSECEELKATLASLQVQLAEWRHESAELVVSLRAAEDSRDALLSLALDQSVAVPLETYGLTDPTDEDRRAFVSFVSRTGYVPPADVIVQYLTARRAHEARMDEWDVRYAALPLGQDDPGYPELRDQKTANLADWRAEVQRIFGDQEVIRRLFGE